MSKICGYSCEHNKSGVCQISGCDKKSIMSDKTEFKIPYQDLTDININNLIVERNTLIQENKKLKEKLDKYENPEDMTLMMMWCTEKVKYENQALKKQVEENKDNYNCLLKQKEQFEYIMSKQVDYQGQQKEFINYLEDEIKLYENDIQNFSKDYNVYFSLINDLRASKAKIEDILQKYKSIIGEIVNESKKENI